MNIYIRFFIIKNPSEKPEFNIDPKFSSCIDALILVHISAIKKERQRYIESHAQSVRNKNAAY